ncbi:MAG TPA: permease-like cell division protein FtsX [Fimbriimonas sp.]
MFDRLSFIFGEAMIALRRNGFMTFAAVTTVAVSLFLLGGTIYLLIHGERAMKTLPNQLDIRVLLKDGVTYPQIVQTAKRLRSIEGVKTAQHVPRDKAWERMRKMWEPGLTEGLVNPLEDAFKVTVADLRATDTVVAEIQSIETVHKVRYQPELQRFLEQAIPVLRWIGGVLGGTLFLTAGILIFNAIKMTILSRRREIRIMSLVGASRWTISFPFLVEGLFQGIAGGTLAGLLLFASNQIVERRVYEAFRWLVPLFPVAEAVAILGCIGGLYGLLCSMIALRMRV